MSAPEAIDSRDVGRRVEVDFDSGTGIELGVPASSLLESMLFLGVRFAPPPPGPMLELSRDDGRGIALCKSLTAMPFLVSANRFSSARILLNMSPIIDFEPPG